LVACALLSIGTLYLIPPDRMAQHERLTTKLGERRAVVLSDGSRLVLNTDSRVTVAFNAKAREVIFEKGQARFEVARDPERPFVVRAGDRQIVATGTAFDVRWTDDRLCVVLVEGHVAILPASAPVVAVPSTALTLHASERVEFRGRAKPVKSKARVDREEAWTTGHVIFESTPLDIAVAEMNRYTPQRLELGDPSLAHLLISGTFSVGDSRDFARAIAQVFSLRIAARPNAIRLEPSSIKPASKEISPIQ
jgi:transmembrane sensor